MILSSYCQECLCGQPFDNAGAFTRHKKTCLKGKKRLASALTHAKESYHCKKYRVGNNEESPSSLQTTSSRAVSHAIDEALNDLGPSDTPHLVDANAAYPDTNAEPNCSQIRAQGGVYTLAFFFLT